MSNRPFLDHGRTFLDCTANTDLSSFQWKAVQVLDSLTAQAPATGTDGLTGTVGILETAPSLAGENCRVCIFGITKAVAGSIAIAAGERFVFAVNNTEPGLLYNVSSAATYAASTGIYYVGGQVLESTVDSQLVSVFLNPQIVHV